MTSVLQDWVVEAPLRAQGTLLTGVRGCDFAPKNPCDIDERYGCSTGESSPERHLVAFLRFCFMHPADPREVDHLGGWFQSLPPARWKPSQFGHYPQHWYTHLMHAFEMVAYYRPHDGLAEACEIIYKKLARNMHLEPETREQCRARLVEDRIANGTVVS